MLYSLTSKFENLIENKNKKRYFTNILFIDYIYLTIDYIQEIYQIYSQI